MAKKCLMEKAARKPKFSVRGYNRCKLCGRRHAYMRKFGVCRLCFRGVHAQVRRVPPVLPRARGERSHPGRHEGVVVKSERNRRNDN